MAYSWSITAQQALQVSVGLLALSLFVFVRRLAFKMACLAPIMFILINLQLCRNSHIGTRLFASSLLSGSAIIGCLSAGCVLSLASLGTGTVRLAILCVLGPLMLAPLSRVRVDPGVMEWVQGLLSCLLYGMVLITGQAIPHVHEIWAVAVTFIFSGAFLSSAMSILVAVTILPTFNADEAQRHMRDVMHRLAVTMSAEASWLLGAPWRTEGLQLRPKDAEAPRHLAGDTGGEDQDGLDCSMGSTPLGSAGGKPDPAPRAEAGKMQLWRHQRSNVGSASQMRATLAQVKTALFMAKLEPPWLGFLRAQPCWPIQELEQVLGSLTTVVGQVGAVEGVLEEFGLWAVGEEESGGLAGAKRMDELRDVLQQIYGQLAATVVVIANVFAGGSAAGSLPTLVEKIRDLQPQLTAILEQSALSYWSSHRDHPVSNTTVEDARTDWKISSLVFFSVMTNNLSSTVDTLAEQVNEMWLKRSPKSPRRQKSTYRGEDLRILLAFCLGIPMFMLLTKSYKILTKSWQTFGWSYLGQLLRDRIFQSWLKFQLTLTVLLVSTLALLAQYPLFRRLQPQYAFIACVAVMCPKVESNVTRLTIQCSGVATGGVVGYLIIGHQDLASRPAVLATIFTVICFIVMWLSTTRLQPFLMVFLVTFQSMVFCLYNTPMCCHLTNQSLVDYTLGRILSIIFGCAVAMLVCNLVLPWYHSTWALDVLAGVCLDSNRFVCLLYERFAQQYLGGAGVEGEPPQVMTGSKGTTSGCGHIGDQALNPNSSPDGRNDLHVNSTLDGDHVCLELQPGVEEAASMASLWPKEGQTLHGSAATATTSGEGGQPLSAEVPNVMRGPPGVPAAHLATSNIAERGSTEPSVTSLSEAEKGSPDPADPAKHPVAASTSSLRADIQSALAGPITEVQLSLAIETVPWHRGMLSTPLLLPRLLSSLTEMLNMLMALHECLNMGTCWGISQESWVARSYLVPMTRLHEEHFRDLKALFTVTAHILRQEGNLQQRKEAGRKLLIEVEVVGGRLRDRFLAARKELEVLFLSREGRSQELLANHLAGFVHFLAFVHVYRKSLGQLLSIARLVVEEGGSALGPPCWPQEHW